MTLTDRIGEFLEVFRELDRVMQSGLTGEEKFDLAFGTGIYKRQREVIGIRVDWTPPVPYGDGSSFFYGRPCRDYDNALSYWRAYAETAARYEPLYRDLTDGKGAICRR